MNQANVSKVFSQLKFNVTKRPRHLKNIDGERGRLNKLRKTVTALIKHERLELNYNRADEARQYAERLISEAIRHGDCHKETMETADFWLLEKQLVHKLFKVLAPRYEEYQVSYTRMFKAPGAFPGKLFDKAILELRGNPYPPLKPNTTSNRNLIHNVLLDAAKFDFRQEKYAEMAQNIAASAEKKTTQDDAPQDVKPDNVS